jgi:hypothetical protein
MGYPNDLLNFRFLTGMVQKRPNRQAIKQSYIGGRFFPFRDVPERKLSWDVMVAENQLAGIYDPKGQAIPMTKALFGSMFAELVDIKASAVLDPDRVQMIRDPGEVAVYQGGGGPAWAQAKFQKERKHLNENVALVDDAVDSQVEYLGMQLLTTGEIVWPPLDASGAAITVPEAQWNVDMPVSIVFPMRNNWKQQATSLVGYNGRLAANRVVWTDANANPIEDLEIIAELIIEETGLNMDNATVIMRRTLLSRLAFNTTILQWIAGTNREQTGARNFASISEIKDFILTKFGWRVETYDAQWTYKTNNPGGAPTINRVPFMGSGKVIILPNGSENGGLGYMGTTYQRQGDGQYRTGKYAWSVERREPPHDIKVGENLVAFPVVENYDWFIYDALS